MAISMSFLVIVLIANLLHFATAKDSSDSHNLITDNCHSLHFDNGTDLEVLNARDVDYIKGKIRNLISDDETGCSHAIREDFIAVFVRLAWHDVATWDCATETGGAHANMRFAENPESPDNELDNKGLERYIEYLDVIHDIYADRISRADLWALAAVTAIEYGSGLSVPFHWGRTDEQDPEVGYPGRLPEAYQGDESGEPDQNGLYDHLLSVFERLEFEDPLKAFVVLSGAHNMGGPRPSQSQMLPSHLIEPLPWSPIGKNFHNVFYSEVLWSQWWPTPAERPDASVLLHASNRSIMFFSDMNLLHTERGVELVHLYATNKQLWMEEFSEMFSFLLERGYPEGTFREIETTYLWGEGNFRMCSEPCGGGTKTRSVKCIAYPDMEHVDDDFCYDSRDASATKPAEVRPCNDQPCMDYAWYYGEWSTCDRACDGGIQVREVECIRVDNREPVDDDDCYLLNPPPSMQSCNTLVCGIWQPIPGTEGECDMPCENTWLLDAFPLMPGLWTGQATSEFKCMRDYDGNLRDVDDSYCDENTRPEFVKCITRFCDQTLPHWRATLWSLCTADCYGGTQTREVSCWIGTYHSDFDEADEVPDELCLNPPEHAVQQIPNAYIPPLPLPEMPAQWGPKPITERACNVKDCEVNTLKREGGRVEHADDEADPTTHTDSADEDDLTSKIILSVVIVLGLIGVIFFTYKIYRRRLMRQEKNPLVVAADDTPLLVEPITPKMKEEHYQTFD